MSLFKISKNRKSNFVGKSTISRLLLRYYDTNEGVVLVDNQNIKHVTQESLRKCISVVPQNTGEQCAQMLTREINSTVQIITIICKQTQFSSMILSCTTFATEIAMRPITRFTKQLAPHRCTIL